MAASYLKYTPKTFNEIVLPAHIKGMLEAMILKNEIQPMLFYGEPGCGKTLTATLLHQGADVFRCDGDLTNSQVVEYVRAAARTPNVLELDQERLIVLDEVDRLDKQYQDKLRSVIDSTGRFTSFIATTNHLNKISDALKSRFMPVDFNVDRKNLTMRNAWKQRLEQIYRMEFGIEADPKIVGNALIAFPDARNMIAVLFTGHIMQ